MEVRRLHPEPGLTSIDAQLAGVDLGARAHPERPWLVANFIASADGRATTGGRSAPLGGPADRAMFHALRGAVDAVLVGTGTLAVERYGRMIRDPGRREQRVRAGRSPEPLAVTVTRSGVVPFDVPLFSEPAATVVVYSAAELPAPELAARVHVRSIPPGDAGAAAALEDLRSRHGVRSVLCEGGPSLFGALVRLGLADELFLTVAPRLAGGGAGLTVTEGAPAGALTGLDLTWALEHDGFLLLRYALRRPAEAPGAR